MRHRIIVIAAVGVVVSALGVTAADATPAGRQTPGDDRLDVYVGTLDLRQLETLRASGIDPHDIAAMPKAGGQLEVEVVVSGEQADELADQGVDLELKEVNGESAAEMSTRLAAAGYTVFRPYSGPGGLKEEFEQLAKDHPDIAKLVVIGKTVQGQDIIALKITQKARKTRDGSRPATLFSAAQHAREWITPEMIRRLLHYVARRLRHATVRSRKLVEEHRDVVRARRQPRRLRLHVQPGPRCGARTCATTTATA